VRNNQLVEDVNVTRLKTELDGAYAVHPETRGLGVVVPNGTQVIVERTHTVENVGYLPVVLSPSVSQHPVDGGAVPEIVKDGGAGKDGNATVLAIGKRDVFPVENGEPVNGTSQGAVSAWDAPEEGTKYVAHKTSLP
jgi:hypothetical protein